MLPKKIEVTLEVDEEQGLQRFTIRADGRVDESRAFGLKANLSQLIAGRVRAILNREKDPVDAEFFDSMTPEA